MYEPKPIDTTAITLSPELTALIERLSENCHDTWATTKIGQGKLDHPDLKPYAELDEPIKDYDRNTVTSTLKAILALGWRMLPPDQIVPLPTEITNDFAWAKELGMQGYEVKTAIVTEMNYYLVMQRPTYDNLFYIANHGGSWRG